jgi:Na+-driven multidrug efflux pump
VAAVCIILGSTFQAFARSIYSLIVSLCRQLIVLIPAAWLLSRLGEVTCIWFAFPIAEAVSLVISLLLYRKIRREIIDTL